MNRRRAIEDVEDRLAELSHRYALLCYSKDEQGRAIAPATAATNRSLVKRDIRALSLVLELLHNVKCEEIPLSDDAEEGFEKLVEPLERHRLRR
jgi:hypothetical protein